MKKTPLTIISSIFLAASSNAALMIIDDDDAGFSATGWSNFDTPADHFDTDLKFINDGGTNAATYTWTGLSANTYEVFAQWHLQANRSTDVEYTISGYGGSDVVISGINQRNAPTADATADDTNGTGRTTFDFQKLSQVSVTTGTLTLAIRDNDGTSANTFAIADASAIQAVPEPSSTALLGLGGLALMLRRKK